MTSRTSFCLTTGAMLATALALPSHAASVDVIGVDFEDGSGGFSIAPDDLVSGDGITVSGWTFGTGGSADVGVKSDNGANSDDAFEGNFVGRVEALTTPNFFTVAIDDSTTYDLTNLSFAYRGGTGSNSSRELIVSVSVAGGSAITVYDVDNSNNALPGRNATPDWVGARTPSISLTDPAFQGLTDTTARFEWLTTGGIDVDAIVISAAESQATVIPTPSAALAGVIGLGGLALRRRGR